MKVTANMLYYDTINGQEQFDKWHECMATPIVPRKMVEMIIERCKEIQFYNDSNDSPIENGHWGAADEIKDYAESLLEQFEEDTEKGVE